MDASIRMKGVISIAATNRRTFSTGVVRRRPLESPITSFAGLKVAKNILRVHAKKVKLARVSILAVIARAHRLFPRGVCQRDQ